MKKTFARKRLAAILMIFMLLAAAFSVGYAEQSQIDYTNAQNWAYVENGAQAKSADVFFVCPTVYKGEAGAENMSLDDEHALSKFVGAMNMEKGIYDASCRFFAPYYRQAGLVVYAMESAEEQEPYLQFAYNDVKAAFECYLEYDNQGRPIILAGFSQGADLCIRLMKDMFGDEKLSNQLVACYAIGWRITAQDVKDYPQLKPATGETDIGVIVSFNTEAENIHTSMMVPAGTKTFSINPLNWKTDGSVADRTLNKGACFTDYSGSIVNEIPELTGAYIDSERGTLKATDVTADEYPPVLTMFEDGIYHLYDYQFFYRDLQENVQTRIASFR